MRRKDREMPNGVALEIIDEAQYGVMSLARDNEPYGIPLSIVRDGNKLFFHTAKEGHKYDFIQDGAPVAVVFVTRVQVPQLYSNQELDEMMKTEDIADQIVSQVYTTEFASAMIKGKLTEVFDDQGKEHALELVCKKYTPDKMKYFKLAVESGMALTRVFEISLAEVSAKRKQFDGDKVEMKFGRVE
ncbi:MAG: pyridoxamine 5'-phosphate oxidase family protein [Clostridiaceae bacterium]